MQNLPDNVITFLNQNALKDYNIEWQSKKGISNVIVIPAIAEYDNIKVLIALLSQNDFTYFTSSLVLFVINNSLSSNTEVTADNLKSLNLLYSIIDSNSNDGFAAEIIRSGLQVGLIDASSNGRELNTKHSGVGLARKIGMDLALTVFDYSTETNKLIICLDADCKVPPNYLTRVITDFNKNNYSVAIINYEHKIDGNDINSAAIICYEIYLRYYVVGLEYAESLYAFDTIGSTIVCDHNAYIKAGGMNKRKAAEDFYFLEKLSKNFKIGKINSTTVFPSNRSSWRVPFGTGQRVTRFIANIRNEYLLLNPSVFEILKDWLMIYNSDEFIDPQILLNRSNEIHAELYNFLLLNNYTAQWKKILSNTKSDKQLQHQKKIWFDGFKTLKLIHHLRDTAFPEVNMFDALDSFFIKLGINILINRNGKAIPEIDIQKEYLYILRNLS
ncbi:MAG: glycosyltransferase [Bacteroidetes bacterium]|nr:glycosyltransferase [Bacteroidota bacterium]